MPEPPFDDWQADKYDESHRVSREHGEELLELLSPGAGERVLDLGCGTGHFAAEISERGALVVGLDASREMVERARDNYPGLSFVEGDATELEFEADFDAVFTNSVLHWIQDQDSALSAIHDLLKRDGRFVGELGAEGNLDDLLAAAEEAAEDRGIELNDPWFFPGREEYVSMLEERGFRVEETDSFRRETPLQGGQAGLRKWLDVFGGELVRGLSRREVEDFYEDVGERLRSTHFDGERWWIDYRRLRFQAVKA